MVRPSSASRPSRFWNWTRCRGSAPFRGSSRIRTSGSWTSVAASRIRCRMPREYVPRRRCAACSRSTRPIALSTAASRSVTPRRRAIIRTKSRPRRNEYTVSCSDMTPIRRYRGGLSRTGSPNMVTVPSETAASPVIIRSSVVFPAPFGPRRPVTPGVMSKVTSLTATTSPNALVTPLTATIGGGAFGSRGGDSAATVGGGSWLIRPPPACGSGRRSRRPARRTRRGWPGTPAACRCRGTRSSRPRRSGRATRVGCGGG